MNRRLFYAICMFFGLLSNTAAAQNITLTSASKTIIVSGEFISYDGNAYRIKTDIGRITIADKNLSCQGRACPSPQDRIDVFSITPSQRITRKTITALLNSFAKTTGINAATHQQNMVNLSHPTDGTLARVNLTPTDINLNITTTNGQTAIGFDAVKIISNAPVLNGHISAKTLRAIWNGTLTNWSELGGSDTPIRLIIPIFADDLHAALKRFDPKLTPKTATQNIQHYLSSDAIAQEVAKTTDTIGLTYQSPPSDAALAIETTCGILKHPTPFAIQSMDYPLAFPINIATSHPYPPETAHRIQAYATTPPAQKLLAQTGMLPLVGLTAKINYENASDISAFTRTASRLSTTFYFAPNGRDLDRRSSKLLKPLAALLNSDIYKNRKITAVGYSDSSGHTQGNLTVSKRRAKTVQSLLADLGVNMNAIGFGEVAPIACNTTNAGREKNRRVEIWVAD